MHPVVTYFVKRPGASRRSYALIRRAGKSQTTVQHEKINAFNNLIGVIPAVDLDAQVGAFVKSLNLDEKKKRAGGYVASEANRKLLKEYWEAVYSTRKVSKAPAWARLYSAVNALGMHSILGDRATLQECIDNQTRGNPRRQRRFVSVINQLRGYFGVREKLSLEKKTHPEFRYLTEREFRSLDFRDPHLELLAHVLFYTGTRVGEAMGLRPEDYRSGALWVSGQVDRDGVRRSTKTNTTRRTVVWKNGQKSVKKWLELPKREAYCRNSLARMFRRICKRAFPSQPSKWLCLHDLRHSFAVMCLTEKGCSLTEVAKFLGNSESVCETYYLRFVMTDDLITRALKRDRAA